MVRYSYFYQDYEQGLRNAETWRVEFVTNVHYFCLIVVLAETIINKIRIPFHHVFYNIILTAIYFLITYVGQIFDEDSPIYIQDLNWNCTTDWSYLVEWRNSTTNSKNDAEP